MARQFGMAVSIWRPKEMWFVSVKDDGSIDRDWPGNADDAATPQERLMGDGTRIVKVTPVAESRERIETAEQLIHDLADHETRNCQFDHNGDCQMHGWFMDGPDDRTCPIPRAREFLDQL